MDNIKSKREKQIENFIDSIQTQEDFLKKQEKTVRNYFKIYKEELEDYNYISSIEEFINLKNGGYIRYINLNDELKWGGILLKKFKYDDLNMMVLCNSYCKNFNISFDKNVIFYKKHTTQADKTRKLFLSYLDKYE